VTWAASIASAFHRKSVSSGRSTANGGGRGARRCDENAPIEFRLGDRHAEITGSAVERAGAATRLDRRQQTGSSKPDFAAKADAAAARAKGQK
jgi:hypothetical protein